MAYRLLGFLMGSVFITTALAGPVTSKNDPKRQVGKISRDLGVTSVEFVACFNTVNPTPGGRRPESGQRIRANKKVLLSCLQKANPSITNALLDTLMDRYLSGGRGSNAPAIGVPVI